MKYNQTIAHLCNVPWRKKHQFDVILRVWWSEMPKIPNWTCGENSCIISRASYKSVLLGSCKFGHRHIFMHAKMTKLTTCFRMIGIVVIIMVAIFMTVESLETFRIIPRKFQKASSIIPSVKFSILYYHFMLKIQFRGIKLRKNFTSPKS